MWSMARILEDHVNYLTHKCNGTVKTQLWSFMYITLVGDTIVTTTEAVFSNSYSNDPCSVS